MFAHSKPHKNKSNFLNYYFSLSPPSQAQKDSISQLDLAAEEKSLGIHPFPSQHKERKALHPLETFFSRLGSLVQIGNKSVKRDRFRQIQVQTGARGVRTDWSTSNTKLHVWVRVNLPLQPGKCKWQMSSVMGRRIIKCREMVPGGRSTVPPAAARQAAKP